MAKCVNGYFKHCSSDGGTVVLLLVVNINIMAAQTVQRDAYIGEKKRQIRDGKSYTVFPNTAAYLRMR